MEQLSPLADWNEASPLHQAHASLPLASPLAQATACAATRSFAARVRFGLDDECPLHKALSRKLR